MTARDHWQAVWTAKSPEQVSWFQDDPAPSLAMIDVPPTAAVIDVGGGASRLVDRLLEKGFTDLTVLDIAAAALERSQARLGAAAARVVWIAADLLEWTPGRQWDLWHDRAVFHFLTAPEQRRRYVALLTAAVKPGGQVVLANFAPDGPEKCSGLPVWRTDAAGLTAELGEGFRLVAERREEHHTPGGSVQRFQWSRFEKV